MISHTKQWMPRLGLLLLCACASNVTVDYDKTTDFSRYHTYSWGQGMPAKNPETDRQIVEAIDGQLGRKGLTKIDADPDLVVTYHAATHEEVDYNIGSDASTGPRYGSTISPSALDVPMRVKLGTVVVDMYDTKQKRKVWHGEGSDVVRDNPARRSEEIRKGAEKMFEQFPPRP